MASRLFAAIAIIISSLCANVSAQMSSAPQPAVGVKTPVSPPGPALPTIKVVAAKHQKPGNAKRKPTQSVAVNPSVPPASPYDTGARNVAGGPHKTANNGEPDDGVGAGPQ